MQSKLTTRGRVTIPKELRDRLGIVPGSRVEFIEEDGRIVLVPARGLKGLRGVLKGRTSGDPEDAREAARKAVSRRVKEEPER